MDQKTEDIQEDNKPFVNCFPAGCLTALKFDHGGLYVGAVAIVYGLAIHDGDVLPVAPAVSCTFILSALSSTVMLHWLSLALLGHELCTDACCPPHRCSCAMPRT